MAEPLKATFFTLKRRDRAVLLPATLVFIGVMAMIIAAFVALNWGTLVHFREIFESARANEQLGEEEGARFVMSFFGLFGAIFLLMFPLYLTVAAYEAACLRWMIRGEAPGLFGMTIDNDVWRVYGVYWCWLIAQFAVSTVASFFMMPLMFMTMGEILNNPTPEAMLRWQFSVQLPIMLLQYIPLIFIAVRFAPAAATSVLRKRFSFFEAWTVTRGRFSELLGSFAVLWLLAGLAIVVIVSATYGVVLGDLAPAFVSGWPTFNAEELARHVFSPQSLALIGAAYAANGVVFLIYSVMSYGVNAHTALAALEEGRINPATT